MWTKRFYIAISLIPFLVGLIGFVALLNSPYLGIEFESRNGKWYISSVSPDTPAANLKKLVGKEVIAIGDLRPEVYDLAKSFDRPPSPKGYERWLEAQRFLSVYVRAGVPVKITVGSEGGDIESFPVTPSFIPPHLVVSRVWAGFFVSAFSILIGLMVAMKKPDDRQASVFFLSVFFACMIFTSFISWSSRDISMEFKVLSGLFFLESTALMFWPASFLHFCLVFPRGKKGVRHIWIVYLASVLFAFGLGYHIYFVISPFIFLSCLAAGLATFMHSYMNVESPDERAMTRWVLWGGIALASIYLFLWIIPIILTGRKLVSYDLLFLSFGLLPLSIAFAIMKYRLMDIDTLLDNTSIYSITLGGLALVDIGATSFLMKFKVFYLFGPAATVITTWIIIFAYLPFRNMVNRVIKRLLKREIYDLNDVSMKLSTRLLSARDIHTIIETAEEIINETLHPKGIETVLVNQNLPSPPFVKGGLRGILSEELLLIKEPRPLSSILPSEDLPKEYSCGVVVPLIVSAGTAGGLMLQNKHSDRLYSGEDMRLLRTVSNQTALAVENILHREDSVRQEVAARAEKERISREIHDGMGSYFTNAIMMVDMIESKNRRAEGDEESLKNLKKLLTDGVADLRDLIWTVEEEDSTLFDTAICIKGKVAQFLNKEKIKHDVEVSVGNERLIIPQMVRLNMLRIVQESVTNIIKHAEADNVFISINEKDKKITIKIKDNGKGFLMDSSKKGFGLRNIRKRCEQMGARLNIYSEPSKGTEIEVESTG